MVEKSKHKNEIEFIFQKFNECGYEAYLVGGCVRDFLLGRKINDYDFTTKAKPSEIISTFSNQSNVKIIETGIKHGTVTIVVNGVPFEVTTFRIDGEYLDHRHPNQVEFTSDIKGDLSRRDFTINALAYSQSGGVVDIFNGIADLKNKQIKCCGNPHIRFYEDSLRILRAIRFASVLGFEIECETEKAMFSNKDLLKNISMERISKELNGILLGKNAGKVLYKYVDILGVVIPELLTMKNFNQHNPHHKFDVWQHTCVAIQNSQKVLSLRLALLFHDIGKPKTFTMDQDEIGHFKGHNIASYEIAKLIFDRLKYGNMLKNEVLRLIKEHSIDLYPKETIVRKQILKYGYDLFDKLLSLRYADNKAKANIHDDEFHDLITIRNIIKKLKESNTPFTLNQLKVNGNDLIELGIENKIIGKCLKNVLTLVATGKLENDKDTIIKYLKNIM